MARWDIFDSDRRRESEPRASEEKRKPDSASGEVSIGRGGKDDSSGNPPQRPLDSPAKRAEGHRERRAQYRDRDQRYSLRQPEIQMMADIGRFRTVDKQDLARFLYAGREDSLKHDIENLRRQDLIEERTVFQAHKKARRVVTLTEQGHRVVRKASGLPREQQLYHGFVKPREIHHDADLYKVYQEAASEIEEAGGRLLKIRLDFELKAAVQREKDALKRVPPEERLKRLQSFASAQGLSIQGSRVTVPDIQVEYETRDHELARANLELVSENYRGEAIRGKAESGFSLYARGNDVSRVRRALQDTHTVERILSI